MAYNLNTDEVNIVMRNNSTDGEYVSKNYLHEISYADKVTYEIINHYYMKYIYKKEG